MKTYKIFLAAAAALSACGCVSFNSGDVRVERETAQAMFDDRALTPFAEIQLVWRNYPYRHPTDAIAGDTTVDEKGNFSSQKIKPVPAPPDDTAALLKAARKIFSEAGLYDRKKGRGALRLELASMNRWTYGDLVRSYLVDTSFIFLIPSSLRVNYLLTAELETSTGTVRVETLGQNKTTFHLLLAPLYPFFAPGGKEKGLLRQMLWRSATEVYDRLKRAGQAPAENPAAPPAAGTPAAAEPVQPAAPAQSAPPESETPDD